MLRNLDAFRCSGQFVLDTDFTFAFFSFLQIEAILVLFFLVLSFGLW